MPTAQQAPMDAHRTGRKQTIGLGKPQTDTKAHRKAAAPQLLPGRVLGEGAKPQPSLAMLTLGESPPASWGTHSSENCSVLCK